MNHAARATLASFLAYCVMSGMLAPIGVVLPALADTLQLPLEEAAPLFTWLTMGVLVGSALALVVFDFLSLRASLLLVYGAIVVSLLLLRFLDLIWVLRLSLGVVGVACGIGLAAGASTIALLYASARRASMLVVTDSAFSLSGAAVSALAAWLVAQSAHWASAYLLVALLSVAIIALAIGTAMPVAPQASPGQAEGAWPRAVWLSMAALLLYTLGQQMLLLWLPAHLETALAVPRGEAGIVVSRYWSGMFMGQLVAAWWVLRVGARGMLLISIIGAFLGSLPLWLVSQPALLPGLALLWGLLNFGLLKIVIASASLYLSQPPPRLLSALLFAATLGTAVSPLLSSAIVESLGTLGVLRIGSLCYFVMVLLLLLARSLPTRGQPQAPRQEPLKEHREKAL